MNLSKTPEWLNRKSIIDKAISKVIEFFLFLVNLFKMGGTGSKVTNNGDVENNGDQEQNLGLFQISFDHISGSFMTIIVIMILITIVLVLRRYWIGGGARSGEPQSGHHHHHHNKHGTHPS